MIPSPERRIAENGKNAASAARFAMSALFAHRPATVIETTNNATKAQFQLNKDMPIKIHFTRRFQCLFVVVVTVESAYSGHGYSGHPLIVVNFESPEFFLQFSSKNRPLTVVKNPLIVVNFKNFHLKSDDFWTKMTHFIFFWQALR